MMTIYRIVGTGSKCGEVHADYYQPWTNDEERTMSVIESVVKALLPCSEIYITIRQVNEGEVIKEKELEHV